MPTFTNVSPGPRVINVVVGTNPDTQKPQTAHVTLLPGVTSDEIEPDETDAVFCGLIETKQIVRGTPDNPAPAPQDFGAMQAAHSQLAMELAEVRRLADEARVKGVERIAELERSLAAKDAAHEAELERLRDEHQNEIASLTAPAPKK